MLLADISGFTALAERLAKTRTDAAERLTRILNDRFGRLIDPVHDSGGDIVTFVGDALIASWPAGDSDGDAGLRAVECAQRMQEAASSFENDPGETSGLKIALGYGTATAARVGGYAGKWRIVAGGEVVEQLTAAVNSCETGGIVFSDELARHLGFGHDSDAAARASQSSGDRRPAARVPAADEANTDDTGVLRSFVADSVLHRIDAAQEGGWLSDIRDVTCAFIRVEGIDWRNADAWMRLQTALVPIQKRLAEFQGQLDKVLVDEKGTLVIAAFGLPPATTDRKEQRALAAAVALAEDTRAQGLVCDIGLATDRTFCGPVGSAARREYTLIGRAVNLAARLMENARGEIVCDEATYARAGTVAPARSATTLDLKGFSEPLIAYTIGAGARPDVIEPDTETVTVGRDEELAILFKAFEDILDGKGSVTVFEGDAGIGKSRIAAEAAERAAAGGIRCLNGAGQAIETLNPWHAWRSVFGELFDIDAEASPAERAGQLTAGLSRYGGRLDLMPILNPVFGLDLPDTDHTHPIAGEARASSARTLLAAVLRRAAGAGPLAILIDDAHWLDSASWALLAEIVRSRPAIAVVVFTRPVADPSDAVREVFAAAGEAEIALSGLARQDVRRMLADQVDGAHLDDALIDWIYERGEGNPYISQELAYALQEAGIITDTSPLSDPEAQSRLAALTLPRSVEQIVALRIDGLAAADQLALKAASVIGASFTLDMVAAIHPVGNDARRLDEIAENLVEAHMIAPEASGDSVYAFRHRLTQEGAYAMMPGEQRRGLHERVARELERRHADEISPYLSVLAHHWTAAEIDDKALDYLERAGKQAIGGGAYLEAYRMFSSAVARASASGFDTSLAAPERRAAWHRNLAETHYGLGHVAENIAECRRTLSLLGWPVPETPFATARATLRHWTLLALRAAFRPDARKTASAAEKRRTEIAAMAAHRMANAAYTEQKPVLTVLGTAMGARLAMRTDPFVNSARCWGGLATILGLGGMSKVADRLFDRAIREAESLDDLDGLVYALYSRALVNAGIGGRWERIDPDVERAFEAATRLGDVQEQEVTLIVAGGSKNLRGDFEGSYADVQRFLDTALSRRNHQHVAWAYDMQAWARVRQGRFEEAAERSGKFLECLPLVKSDGLSEMHAALAGVYIPAFEGRVDQALQNLQNAEHVLAGFKSPLWAETVPLDIFGEALDALFRDAPDASARKRLLRAERIYLKALSGHAKRIPNAGAVALLHRARAALRAGGRRRAKRLAEAAYRRATELDSSFDLARSLLLLCEFDDGDRAAFEARLRDAREIFERCGAGDYLQRVRERESAVFRKTATA
jgi:class 3 adenylate cyclase/tetratricopeptide (TPR) repeat protein